MKLEVLFLLLQYRLVYAFVVKSVGTSSFHAPHFTPACTKAVQVRGGSSTARSVVAINPALLSVVAGSVAGAIGVGVAFPLDTLKTKSQVLRTSLPDEDDFVSSTIPGSDGSAAARMEKMGMIQLFRLIWEREGLSGFFSGVKGMMAGQAIIKALAFSVNTNTISFLQHHEMTRSLPSVAILLIASCFAGFITSFVVTPIERIKINMQADPNRYKNEIDCLQTIIKSEGVGSLMSRGLGTTLVREIPSYGLYFWIYGLVTHSTFAQLLPGTFAPLIFGALSGMASWLPVYPVDVVKTTLQHGDNKESAWSATRKIYADGGVAAFFDGLDAKMLRAAVNHAVTFFVYDYVMAHFAG
jgi:hypothetical protein